MAAVELNTVARYLEASLDPRQNKQAELALRQEEQKPGFSLALLNIVAAQNFSGTIRLAGALCFKNFIKRRWVDPDGNHLLPAQEVAAIKREIIGLMISVPPNIQSQLGDAVGVIADSDFWRRWDTLVDDLVSRLTPDNAQVNNGVLQVAHSIFKRWRPLFRSDELFTEINHVLEKFCTPFLELLKSTDELIEQNRGNKNALVEYVNTFNLLMKLFYDLSCQDLPPLFEESLGALSSLFQRYLTFDNPLLHTDTDEESGPLEFVKSGILENLSLYVQKYGDAFEGHVATFLQSTWNLLTTVGLETKYDILVSKALRFMTSVTSMREHAKTFDNEATMTQVVERVALPNIVLREADMELFEDEPIEFIRRDLEGSDSESRRRAATEFLRSLLVQHETLTTDIVDRYINHFLNEYSSSPTENWRSKDTAVYLFSSIAAKGVVTAREGVKTINERVDVLQFFEKNVANDLVNSAGVQPILKVDAIKYLYTFRSQLSIAQWATAFSLLVQHLNSPYYVIYTYAAIAVERALALTDPSGQPVVDRTVVAPLSKDLMEHLFRLIEKDQGQDRAQAATKVQENEFLMRCVMRVLIVIREELQPLTEMLLRHLLDLVNLAVLNPSNPRFCYYLFEAIGAVVRFATPAQPALVENAICPEFIAILESENQDFMPYIFQLFAGSLEANPMGSIPDLYKSLIAPILKVDFWLIKGNVPALVRLLTSLIRRGSAEFVSGNHVEPVLGIFQQLFASKASELPAFELLESLFVNFPPTAMQNFYPALMQLILQKLDNSKSETFQPRFTRFYHLVSAKFDEGIGADFFISLLDNVQQGIYTPIYLKIILPTAPTLLRPLDRKLAVISLTKTLATSRAFAETYKKGWGFTCDRLLELLINPPVIAAHPSIVGDEHDVDDQSFGVGFTELVTIRRPPLDYFPDIVVGKEWVSKELNEANQRSGGQIANFVQERLSPKSQTALAEYMQ